MQIVIDIPEEIYNHTQEYEVGGFNQENDTKLFMAIKNGTPLDKIRAEITEYAIPDFEYHGCGGSQKIVELEDVFEIIDKYRKMAIESLKQDTPDFHADWQPISDGLLPDEGFYYVTWEGKMGNLEEVGRYIELAELFVNDYGDYEWDVSRIEKRGYHDIKIIAWMDLPDKWEGD